MIKKLRKNKGMQLVAFALSLSGSGPPLSGSKEPGFENIGRACENALLCLVLFETVFLPSD